MRRTFVWFKSCLIAPITLRPPEAEQLRQGGGRTKPVICSHRPRGEEGPFGRELDPQASWVVATQSTCPASDAKAELIIAWKVDRALFDAIGRR